MLPAPRGSFLHFCRSVAVGMPPLTLGQQTYCAIVFDRREPGSLEGEPREIARQLFGPDVDTVPPVVRRAVVTLKGLRTGGTLLHSVYLLYAALTSKIQNLGPGEVASCMIASPTLALSAQSYRYCLGVAENTPSIARLIEAQTSTRSGGSLTIRRPDGIAVCIETAAKSEGGAATRGRTVVAALIDRVT